MINIAIVEDDEIFCKTLKEYIIRYEKESSEPSSVTIFPNGLEFITNYKPVYDLVFMDIEMPKLDGMTTARKLREIDSEVKLVFVTNMSQYAINGYEVDALDFIVKPINYFYFSVKLNKAIKSIIKNRAEDIFVNLAIGVKRISVKDICYIEVRNHMLIYHTIEGNYELRGSLSGVERVLESKNFARCNSCYLVNLNYVQKLYQNSVIVYKDEVQISRAKKKAFLRTLADYMGGTL